MYTEPKDAVIAKGTDNRAHAHTRQKGTGTVIGTETGNGMAQGRQKDTGAAKRLGATPQARGNDKKKEKVTFKNIAKR